jgi:putative transposase
MEYRKGSHCIYDITYHVVWVTKYRYRVLTGEVALRLRELLRQSCESRDVTIVRGSISKDHVHMLLSCPPVYAPAKIVQWLKGRSSRLMQAEFVALKRRYWGQHLWARGYFCGTVGAVTEEMIKRYVEGQGEEEDEKQFQITE